MGVHRERALTIIISVFRRFLSVVSSLLSVLSGFLIVFLSPLSVLSILLSLVLRSLYSGVRGDDA